LCRAGALGDVSEFVIVSSGDHSWYAPEATRAPTWNFTVAHCYGVPGVLGEEENLDVLTRLVKRFEDAVEEPLHLDRESAAPVARGTAGVRIPVGRFVCKRRLSQDKDEVSRRQVIAALRQPGPYHHSELADEMERELNG